MTNVLAESPQPLVPSGDPIEPVGDRPVQETAPRRRRRRVHGLTIGVFVFSALLVGTASALTYTVDQHTERRLLELQVRQAGAVLETAVGNVRAVLAPAAELAARTNGDRSAFESSMGSLVGDAPGQYRSAVLWSDEADEPLVQLGTEPAIATEPTREASMVRSAIGETGVYVDGIVGDPGAQRLGFGLASRGDEAAYVVYVESALPTPQRRQQRPGEAFSNLNYALYLDDSENDDALLWSSVEDLPIGGERATTIVPFGNAQLLFVATPIEPLSGGLSRTLPWIVASVGLILTFGFSVLAERLLRRRDDAVATSRALAALSDENARLYGEQRGIAATLQRSLLPDHLPALPHADVTARYWPAGTASEVGGDFYDLFEIGDGKWGLSIGDVCGKGVGAAALTGVARHTIQAAARHLTSPAEVLGWVHEAVKAKSTTMFCTVCFGVLVVTDEGPVRLELALGGHPPPLLCRRDGTSAELGVVGTVLGIIEPTLTDRSYELRPGDTLVLFTDGLTDAPQNTSVTMAEIQSAHAAAPTRSPDEIADGIQQLIEARRPLGSGDDTALLIVRVHDTPR